MQTIKKMDVFMEKKLKHARETFKEPMKLVKYWDFDEKKSKEIKLLSSVVDELHKLKESTKPHMNNFETLKLMKLI